MAKSDEGENNFQEQNFRMQALTVAQSRAPREAPVDEILKDAQKVMDFIKTGKTK